MLVDNDSDDGMDNVADIDLANAGAAVDGRDDAGIVELGLGVADLRLVAQDLGARLVDDGLLLVDLLLARIALDDEVLEAVQRAQDSMATASGVPAGALRVTAPLGFGRSLQFRSSSRLGRL